MAHLLADTEQADGFPFGGFVTAHHAVFQKGASPRRRPGSQPARATSRLTAWDAGLHRHDAFALQGALALLDLERLDDVAGLDVGRGVQRDAAFEPGADLGNVILEPAQR